MWQLLVWQRIMDDANLGGRKVFSEQRYSSMDRLHCPVGGKSLPVLDRSALRVHTYHVIGSDDPMLYTTMALINVCTSDKALSFDHGKGHEISCESGRQ